MLSSFKPGMVATAPGNPDLYTPQRGEFDERAATYNREEQKAAQGEVAAARSETASGQPGYGLLLRQCYRWDRRIYTTRLDGSLDIN